ncbi:hypothetical protein PPTG_12143 [Phytophthora nicotianae INRA-310]|uniref:CCHC-type domain-containing protein n=1 Tax=Phytophthora nicotianae (strain INRA-310) TaxID=761204 RepID=W2Q5D8_PHYN3|nr:hypothetical protein PPTG_12143 [Phytophthora nicotianae INRA-310]ETN08337.1 hypothetical protein PPTG_12143 [Phytophthora nicotianae INRA-310]
MSEAHQVSTYCDGLKRATQAYVKLQNATPLSEAIDKAAKYEMSHLSGEHKATREKPRREQQPVDGRAPASSATRSPFSKESFNPGHFVPAEQTKVGYVCYFCKKPGHFKRDCKKLKSDEGKD